MDNRWFSTLVVTDDEVFKFLWVTSPLHLKDSTTDIFLVLTEIHVRTLVLFAFNSQALLGK
jgi:hypothetical protein